MQPDIIFLIVVLIVSTVLHELAHGYMANALGDPTARIAGRLTLNPLSHIDLVGSILLPMFLYLSTGGGFMLGYAKPVPYNPYNLRGKYAEALVAGAGPAMNILLAVIFSILARETVGGAATIETLPSIAIAFVGIVHINLALALFNLIPIPPLDGSKVLSGILPGASGRAYDRFRFSLERLGVFSGALLIILIFYFLFASLFGILLDASFHLLTGF